MRHGLVFAELVGGGFPVDMAVFKGDGASPFIQGRGRSSEEKEEDKKKEGSIG